VSPLTFTIIAFATSLVAGLFGSLVGVGGGIIIVPALTLLLGVDIHFAIAASMVGVIATSTGAAAAYVRQGLANLRLAMVLEVATAAGAIAGAVMADVAPARVLFTLFGCVLIYTAAGMVRKPPKSPVVRTPDALADRLALHGSYFDERDQHEIAYRVTRVPLGLGVSGIAGLLSGLLGIGGGAIKVPVMHLKMGIPLKVCTATSNFMIGVTAAASATVYFMRGDVLPFIAAPVAAGVLVGATAGSLLLPKTRNATIRNLFVIVLIFTATQMIWKGVRPSTSATPTTNPTSNPTSNPTTNPTPAVSN
jgi:uncharacterized protein